MKKVFVNHTNHPSARWSEEQRIAAEKFGTIIDFPFPDIAPQLSEQEVLLIVKENYVKILAMEPVAVLCQGEFCYTIAMTELLKQKGIPVMAACSERCSRESVLPDGSTHKTNEFRFVRFRKY